MDDSKKDDTGKGTLLSLAVTAGMFALGAALADTIERRSRIKDNIDQVKSGKSLNALWERQEKFERAVADFQTKQHEHFELALERKLAKLADATANTLEAFAKRLDERFAQSAGEDKNMPKYPFGEPNN